MINQIEPWIDNDELEQLKRVIDSTFVTESSLTKEFEDHHNYKENEIDNLIKLANENNLKLITTEKDIVKIPKKYHLKINCLKMKIEFDKQDFFSLKSLLKKKLND